MQASATAGWFDTQAEPKAATYPVAWSFDDRDAQAPVTSPWGFSINGTNVASEALEDVHSVLSRTRPSVRPSLRSTVKGRRMTLKR